MLVTSSLGYCVRAGVSLFFLPNLANWHTSTLMPFVIKISLILIRVGQAVNFLSSPKHVATPWCRQYISALSWKWEHWRQFLQKQKVLVFMNQLLHPWLTVTLPALPFFVLISENMCTVVYFDDCVSIRQCKLYCESMGGSKYRWFHNACCQCIGPECVDYGSKAVKCMNCLFWSVGASVLNCLDCTRRLGEEENMTDVC